MKTSIKIALGGVALTVGAVGIGIAIGSKSERKNIQTTTSAAQAQSAANLKRGGKGGKGGASSSKSNKSGKASKASSRLVAFMKPVPIIGRRLQTPPIGNGRRLQTPPIGTGPYGVATVGYNPDNSFLLALDMAGLVDANCERSDDCKMAIHNGTNCTDHGSDHWTMLSANPWTNITYSTYSGEVAELPSLYYDHYSDSAERVNNGYGSAGNEGKVVVLSDDDGDVIACGVLQNAKSIVLKAASFGKYPGYTGPLNVNGTVEVSFDIDGTLEFEYDLFGVEPNCENCGIHIHTGVTCESHAEIGGHYWKTNVVDDLWTTEGGAVYNSTSDGEAEGYFKLSDGFSVGKNYHRAVVIHGSDGTRLGCAILEGELNR